MEALVTSNVVDGRREMQVRCCEESDGLTSSVHVIVWVEDSDSLAVLQENAVRQARGFLRRLVDVRSS